MPILHIFHFSYFIIQTISDYFGSYRSINDILPQPVTPENKGFCYVSSAKYNNHSL